MQELKLINQCPLCKVMNNVELLQKQCLDGTIFLARCKICGKLSVAETMEQAISLWNETYRQHIGKDYILPPQAREKIKEMFGDNVKKE